MRLIIRWRCGDTSRWDGQTHSTASLVCFYAFHWQIGKFSNRRMKTLATLSANGFEAVYTEVRDYGWSTRLFLSLSPDCNYTLRVFFYRHCHVCWSGRDGTVFVDAMQLNETIVEIWKIVTLLIMMNSRNVPSLTHVTYLGVHGGGPRHSAGYEEKILGLFSVCEYSLCMLEPVWPITRHVDNGTVVFSRGI